MNSPQPKQPLGDILVVDDDMPSLRALSSLLKEHGYQVRSARDGSTALMMTSVDPPDLILLDVIMPEMDGIQVCQRLKRDVKTGDIPVIFISALDEVVDKVRGFEVGAIDYITKPYNATEVEVRVRTHLALYKLRKELELEISQRRQTENALRTRTDELGQRVKELNCLYSISALIEQQGISLEEILQGTVDLIPPAWQYPEITCARIVLNGQEFRSENYRETPWKQASPLTVHGQRSGGVEVCYLEERPLAEEGPFLQAERNLLDAIAERLSRVAERFRAEEALRRRVEELSTLNRVAQVVATVTDLGKTLETAAEIVTYLFAARITVITIPEAEEAELRVLAGFEPTSGAFGITSHAFPLNEMPITRQVLDQGQSIVLTDVRQLALAAPVNGFFSDLDLRALMLVPLKVRGAVIGALAVGSDQPERTFTSADVALAETIASDVAAAIENAQLAEQARAAAVDTERGRLARELHDSVTQALYSITLHTDATLLALSAGKIGVVEERLKLLNERARDAMTEMRLLIYELRPSILEESGLAAALRARLDSVETRSDLKADLQVTNERRLPPPVEDALYRVALEGLNNILKHARATSVELHLVFDDSAVCLTIRDDGAGFDLESATRYGGYGLAMMKERVQHIGGTLSIETAPGAGTTLRVEVKV